KPLHPPLLAVGRARRPSGAVGLRRAWAGADRLARRGPGAGAGAGGDGVTVRAALAALHWGEPGGGGPADIARRAGAALGARHGGRPDRDAAGAAVGRTGAVRRGDR